MAARHVNEGSVDQNQNLAVSLLEFVTDDSTSICETTTTQSERILVKDKHLRPVN